jgi:hypothetical protein
MERANGSKKRIAKLFSLQTADIPRSRLKKIWTLGRSSQSFQRTPQREFGAKQV